MHILSGCLEVFLVCSQKFNRSFSNVHYGFKRKFEWIVSHLNLAYNGISSLSELVHEKLNLKILHHIGLICVFFAAIMFTRLKAESRALFHASL